MTNFSSDTIAFAKAIRLKALEMCYRKRTSHIGGAFSVADILAVLYGRILNISPNQTDAPERDRLFYSKGHACVALYAALDLLDFFPDIDLLDEFTKDGSYYTSHINHKLPGIELSTGSLGHALGVSCGAALAGKRRGQSYKVFSILSDGELDEGSNWEAILFAAHHRLNNLVMIVDYNKIQSFGSVSEVMALEPLADKMRAFNWNVYEIDGHDHALLNERLADITRHSATGPTCIIADTVKGKGVSFMEGELAWHYKSPNDDFYEQAKKLLEAGS